MGKNPDVIEATHMVLLSNESRHGDLRLSGGSHPLRNGAKEWESL